MQQICGLIFSTLLATTQIVFLILELNVISKHKNS